MELINLLIIAQSERSLPPKINIQFRIVSPITAADIPTKTTIIIDATAVPIIAPRNPP